MEQPNLNLAALIGSRICHDLISPIGAINNGLELMEMTTPQASPEMALISESVCNASAYIRFFRVAYGAAGGQMMGRPEVTSILGDLTKGGRIDVQWIPQDPVPRGQVRLAFLGLQCLETAMPFGGKVQISCQEDFWTLSGTATKLSFDPDLWRAITDNTAPDDVSPAQVQFALLPLIAAEMGRTLAVEAAETSLKLRF